MQSNKTPGDAPEGATPRKSADPQRLDALTGGALSAPTAGERAARIREWLAQDPPQEQLQEVFRELSARDKGAAKPVRERLDELRRVRSQEAMATEWAQRAQVLLEQARLNIADAMAWQRDAAKAGAPLSREPLATLRQSLAERVKTIEDLQHRAQVQREASVLLAHRIEVLGTKPWEEAEAAWEPLRTDLDHWRAQAGALQQDPQWACVDARIGPQLESSQAQLLAVWEAFAAALAQARTASTDPAAPLPAVPVWADGIRALRGLAAPAPARADKPVIDPQVRERARQQVQEALSRLEAEVSQGHGKASAGAAAALRQALKDAGKLLDDKLENAAHAALAAAGELEGWQRWRADQLREGLVTRAEELLAKPPGGRKLQDALRQLREQWKQTDQGGVPNHALWKRFDEACNKAYKLVEAWLEKVRAESDAARAQRLALIEELKAWSAAHGQGPDWKGVQRELHGFAERWRNSGHLGEKAFEQVQALWKDAIHQAHAGLEAAQAASLARRQALIEEAGVLGAAPMLRVDAVKNLQQRWQAEAQSVPLDRRQEQKLWDAFRKPIDEAFARKSSERERSASALSEHDRRVLEAAKALEQANAQGDVAAIRAAMAALQAASRQDPAAAPAQAPKVAAEQAPAAAVVSPADAQAPAGTDGGATDAAAPADAGTPAAGEGQTATEDAAPAPAPAPAAPKAPARPVVAVRGDDRPGQKKTEPAPLGRGARPGDRRGPDAGRPGDRRGPPERRGDRPGDRFGTHRDDRPDPRDRGPRLGDAAFRAQRDAIEHAEAALRRAAAHAHGEVLTQLLSAWEQRSPDQVPAPAQLGRALSAGQRARWVQALGQAPQGAAQDSLLRLEVAAELPTPAEHLSQRRALQLQLLTRRNDPQPAQTWAEDAAQVLQTAHDAAAARRLQAALKALLRN